MIFEVFITPAAKQRIREQALWIATEQAGPQAAADWLTRIEGTIEGLKTMPRRYPVATEDAWCDYEVRQVSIGQFVLFFTILEGTQTVWVIHARHGRQLTGRTTCWTTSIPWTRAAESNSRIRAVETYAGSSSTTRR